MKKQTRLFHVALIIFVFTLIGCTRNVGDDSQLRFSLSDAKSKASSQAVGYTELIIVNVSGPNMKRELWQWDAHEACGSNCTTPPNPPSQIEMIVPAGNQRLIQVLVVKSFDDESMDFRYGDELTDLDPGDQAVEISLVSAGTSAGGEGGAHGRYLLADGSAYTGTVAMTYDPNVADRPPMEIMRTEMYGGWINLFLLNDVSFKYVVPGLSHTLFGGPVNLSSTVFATAPSVVRLDNPTVYEDDNGTARQRPPSTQVIGFWKDNIPEAGMTTCFDTTSYTFDHRYSDLGLSALLSWPSDFTVAPAGNTCTVTDPLVSATSISIAGELLDHGGGHELINRGPFLKWKPTGGTHYDLVHHTFNSGASQLNLEWKYLPGVFSGLNPMDGVAVFVSKTYTDGNRGLAEGGMGLFDCGLLTQKGFSEYTRVAGPTSSVTINGITSSDLPTTKVVLCPIRGSQYLHTAAETYCIGGCGGGGGSPASKLVMTGPSSINQQACVPYNIEAQDDSGNPGDLPNYPYMITLSATAGSFYDNPACTTAVGSESEFYGSGIFYFKTTTTGTVSLTVESGLSESTPLTSHSLSGLPIATGSVEAGLAVLGRQHIYSTECEPYLIQTVDGGGGPVSSSANYTVTLSAVNGLFYSDYSCTTATSSLSIPIGDTQTVVHFKPNASGSDTITASDSGAYLPNGSLSLNIQDPGPPYRVTIHGNNMIGNSICEGYTIEVFDEYWVTTNVAAALTVDLSTDTGNGQFYSDNTCTTAVTQTSIAASTSETQIWFKSSAIETVTLIPVDNAGSLASEAFSIDVY